jgi:adenine-specific DNA-methyltransferase
MTDEIYETPSTTPNFQTELAAQLADLIPEAIADGKVDVEKLKELLDGDVADSSERFGLFWPGKKRALRAAQEPTTATLKPDFENSKDWDTTQNVFIEGDNLEVLKILQKHYHAKIKLIYIDPPYNTGKDFVYPDNYKEGLDTYLEWTRQVNEEGKKVTTNAETEGRYHSNWLNMMYPRLKLARNLLTDDGAIFISIDDSEMENLKRIAHEVFGENNFVGVMVWAAGRKNDSKLISASHEYILVYARNSARLIADVGSWRTRKEGLDDIYATYAKLRKIHGTDHSAVEKGLRAWYRQLSEDEPAKRHKHYSAVDARGVYFPSDLSKNSPTSRSKYDVFHPVTGKAVSMPTHGWRYAPEQMQQLLAEDRIRFGPDESTRPTYKRYLTDAEDEIPYSVFYVDSRGASGRLNRLLGGAVFENPKDENVLQKIIEFASSDNDIVLDFFAGSGSTAHAVMLQNVKDGGRRRFVQVQLPEPTPDGSVARKMGFMSISEISRRRIALAGSQILNTAQDKLDLREQPLDIGFRAYTLADSNFSKWRLSSDVEEDALQQHLLSLRDSATDEATADDLLTEILLKQGYSLTETISPAEVGGLDVRLVHDRDGDVAVLAYLNEHVKPTLEQLRALVDESPTRIIVLEDAFQGDDELKTNLAQLARAKGIELWTA